LTRVSILSRKMDCRIKPGDDDFEPPEIYT